MEMNEVDDPQSDLACSYIFHMTEPSYMTCPLVIHYSALVILSFSPAHPSKPGQSTLWETHGSFWDYMYLTLVSSSSYYSSNSPWVCSFSFFLFFLVLLFKVSSLPHPTPLTSSWPPHPPAHASPHPAPSVLNLLVMLI